MEEKIRVDKKRFANAERYTENIIDREDSIKSFNTTYFVGDVYFKKYIHIKRKHLLNNGLCIQDDNYKWLQFYQYDKRVCLTAVYDNNNNIVEWYFDIAKVIGKENGMPYQDDMYLDVVLKPNGEVVLLDEDEFKEAFERKEFTKEEYDEAYKIAYELMNRLKNRQNEMKEFTDYFFNIMLGNIKE